MTDQPSSQDSLGEALRGLPAREIDNAARERIWARLEQQLEGNSWFSQLLSAQFIQGLQPTAVAASLVLAAALLVIWQFNPQTQLSRERSVQQTGEPYPTLADLQTQSAMIELLRRNGPQAELLDGDRVSLDETLSYRLRELDQQLGGLHVRQAPQDQKLDLWQRRVDLLEALVHNEPNRRGNINVKPASYRSL